MKHGVGTQKDNQNSTDDAHPAAKFEIVADLFGEATSLGQSDPDTHHYQAQTETEEYGYTETLGNSTGCNCCQQGGNGSWAWNNAA